MAKMIWSNPINLWSTTCFIYPYFWRANFEIVNYNGGWFGQIIGKQLNYLYGNSIMGYFYMTWLIFGILFLHLSTSLGCFSLLRFFLNNRLDYIQWASFISYLYTKIRIIRSRVQYFTPGSPCGIWGLGWSTYLLYDGPLLGLCFLNDSFVCNFAIVERIFQSISSLILVCLYITQVLPVIFRLCF